MKNYELRIEYKNGEIRDYYSEQTGNGFAWESNAETPEAALEEMKEIDRDLFCGLAEDKNVSEYWVEEVEPERATFRLNTSSPAKWAEEGYRNGDIIRYDVLKTIADDWGCSVDDLMPEVERC